MAVRSKRLWGPTVVSTADVLLYTCPDGETALVKHLTVVNNAALPSLMLIRLNGETGSSNIYSLTIASTAHSQLVNAFWVLRPGDQLHAIAERASSIVAGFGAELEGVAD